MLFKDMMVLWCSAIIGFVARVLGKIPVKGFVFINIIIVNIIITITIIIIIDIINIHVSSPRNKNEIYPNLICK